MKIVELQEEERKEMINKVQAKKDKKTEKLAVPGVSIAPIESTCIDVRYIDRLIKHLLKKNPHLIRTKYMRETDKKNVSYKVVDKEVHGPRWVKKPVRALTKLKELDEAYKTGPTSYNQDDRVLHEKLRD